MELHDLDADARRPRLLGEATLLAERGELLGEVGSRLTRHLKSRERMGAEGRSRTI